MKYNPYCEWSYRKKNRFRNFQIKVSLAFKRRRSLRGLLIFPRGVITVADQCGNKLSATRWMKLKRMGITEILKRIWILYANKIKSSDSFSKQPTQLIIELNSSLRHIIVTIVYFFLWTKNINNNNSAA